MFPNNLSECKDPSDYAYCTCAVYSCGYSQPNRKNLTFKRLENGTAESDCSAAVNTWLYWGKFLDELVYFYTAIEVDYLMGKGFAIYDMDATPKRNDVLWRNGHTGLYIGDNLQAELLRDENHDAGWEGTIAGDQDGGESIVTTYQPWNWTCILRLENPSTYDDGEKEREDDMTFVFRPNGDEGKPLMLYDGGIIHPLAKQNELDAVREAYKNTYKKEIPMFSLGNKENKLGDAFISAIKRNI